MTAIPFLRPPRKSPATAYLKHLQQERRRKEVVNNDNGEQQQAGGSSSRRREDFGRTSLGTSNPGAVTARVAAPVAASPLVKKPLYGMAGVGSATSSGRARLRSTATAATAPCCVSDCSESEDEPTTSEESCSSHFLGPGGDSYYCSPNNTKNNNNNSNGGDSFPITTVVSSVVAQQRQEQHRLAAGNGGGGDEEEATTCTALVNVPNTTSMPPHLTSQVIAIEESDGSFALEALLSISHDEDDDDDDLDNGDHDDHDDNDSLAALDRLLAETSRRWEESCQQTHRDFCRVPRCECKTQDLIQQQQAEIEDLRAQLEARASVGRDHDHHHHADYCSPLGGGGDEEPREDILPIEQIEVYHDSDDHLSVTSGLTHIYDLSRVDDAASSIFQTMTNNNNCSSNNNINNNNNSRSCPSPSPATNEPHLQTHRPDAESVTGVQSVQPSRVRDFRVEMVAADGTLRHASYSGPLYKGKPHGCGIFKFVDTGNVYMGDVVMGEMHGQGTYTVAAPPVHNSSKGKKSHKGSRKVKVLKGTFENNVFIG